MSAPRKAYKFLLVKVQSGQRLATSPAPSLAFREVTLSFKKVVVTNFCGQRLRKASVYAGLHKINQKNGLAIFPLFIGEIFFTLECFPKKTNECQWSLKFMRNSMNKFSF